MDLRIERLHNEFASACNEYVRIFCDISGINMSHVQWDGARPGIAIYDSTTDRRFSMDSIIDTVEKGFCPSRVNTLEWAAT